MKPSLKYLILLSLAAVLGLTRCTSYAESLICGEQVTPYLTTFPNYFSDMNLTRVTSGDENSSYLPGRIFTTGDDLAIFTNNTVSTEIRLCIFELKPNGATVHDENYILEPGPSVIPIDGYPPGSYIIRVYTDDILVNNIQFRIDENK